MRIVKQDDPTGCGIACIAMLAGTDYSSVKELAVKQIEFDNSVTFYTDTNDLKKLGKNFNIELGEQRDFKSFQELPEIAILAINYNKNSERWHWVVYRRNSNDEFVCDPRKTIKTDKRRDFGRIKAKWFVPVTNT